MLYRRSVSSFLIFFTLVLSLLANQPLAAAAQLTLTWNDNSDNEAGFTIERRIGAASYQQLVNVAAGVTTYTDLNLSNGTTYCYHVMAFNSAGSSSSSNENCATTAAASFTVAVNRAGTGTGTITSSPAGIACGADCSEAYVSGTAVTLTAVAASGSVFAGWSGTGCTGGNLTVNGNLNCAATFNLQTYSLTLAKAGTGSGTVTSSPAGINCGSACSASFNSGTVVALTATPAAGSTFTGWSGTGCSSGSVTINANTTCTATFNLQTATLTLVKAGTGSGTVTSAPAGINCGSSCSASFNSGTVIALSATPAAGSTFDGWSGTGCSSSVTVNSNRTCTANFGLSSVTLSITSSGNGTITGPSGISCSSVCSYNFAAGSTITLKAVANAGFAFTGWSGACTGTSDCTVTLSSSATVASNFFNDLTDKIGVYRPSTGEWFLDRNGNGGWEGCGLDLCARLFDGVDGVPVAGDWDWSGVSKVGLFLPDSKQWLLDANGNGIWDGCDVDTCIGSFGQSTDVPVVGRWAAGSRDWIAIFRPNEKKWHLDTNGNGRLDACKADKCLALSVYHYGDVPLAGDWTGRGTTQLGLFRPSTNQWFLDKNANRAWNGCSKDLCVTSFGTEGDVPVTGDWNGTGVSNIGVFRPSTGEWFLDLNGNGAWDGPELDLYAPGYGQPGDIPVVGRW